MESDDYLENKNHNNYNESLKILLEYGYKEYNNLAIDRQNLQLAYLKTYISLSSVIIGAIVSTMIFFEILPNKFVFQLNRCELELGVFFIILSFLLAVVIFISGVDLLRGRERRPIPLAGIKKTIIWMEKEELRLPSLSNDHLETELLKSLLKAVAESVEDLVQITERIGTRLRTMSIGLIASAGFGLTGVLIRIFTSS